MGQNFLIVNLSKKQVLNPFLCGDGNKIFEFANSSNGAMTALAILLLQGCGGDWEDDARCPDPIVGSWAGDRIVIAGEYGKSGKYPPLDNGLNLYRACRWAPWTEISQLALRAMATERNTREAMMRRFVTTPDAPPVSLYEIATREKP
jgi:hypothetical protein